MSNYNFTFAASEGSLPATAGPSEPPAPAPAVPQTRQQCWECLRRRWVCDANIPVCNKCRAAGIVCPGYSDRKPLTWLAPGRVTSRNRKPRANKADKSSSEKGTSASGKKSAESSRERSRATSKTPTQTAKARVRNATSSASRAKDSTSPRPVTSDRSITVATSSVDFASQPSSGMVSGDSFALALRSSPPAVGVKDEGLSEYWPPQWSDQWSLDQAAASRQSEGPQISGQWVENIGWELAQQDTSYKPKDPALYDQPQMRLEINDFFEAATYYNEHLYPSMARNQLVPGPFVKPFVDLDRMPPSIRHSLIALVLGHRILEMPRDEGLGTSLARIGPGPVYGPAARMWWRIQHHMQHAIRYLNEDIQASETRFRDVTLAGIFVFLVAELHHSTSPHWRSHIDGLLSLISLRGGLAEVMEQSPQLQLSLLSFTLVCVVANTSGPPANQIGGSSHYDQIDTIAKLQGGFLFPTFPCPLPLFINIIRINHVRRQYAIDPNCVLDGSIFVSAQAIINDVLSFSPEEWTRSFDFPTRSELLLVAQMFQSCVVLYSLSTLPTQSYSDYGAYAFSGSFDGITASTKAYHCAQLMRLLEQAVHIPVLERAIVWPMIVAGVMAVDGLPSDREFVEQNLSRMANVTGGYLLVAKWTLERFWISGKTTWDECFYQQSVLVC